MRRCLTLFKTFPLDVDSPSIMQYLVNELQKNKKLASFIGLYLNDKKNISKKEKKILQALAKSEDITLRAVLVQRKIMKLIQTLSLKIPTRKFMM